MSRFEFRNSTKLIPTHACRTISQRLRGQATHAHPTLPRQVLKCSSVILATKGDYTSRTWRTRGECSTLAQPAMLAHWEEGRSPCLASCVRVPTKCLLELSRGGVKSREPCTAATLVSAAFAAMANFMAAKFGSKVDGRSPKVLAPCACALVRGLAGAVRASQRETARQNPFLLSQERG